MEAKFQETTLGENICKKIKEIYFTETKWIDCYKEVAQKYTSLKHIMRKFYTDKTEIEILQELNKYSTEDIKDAFVK